MSSSAEDLPLARLQEWLLTVTTDPGGLREGVRRARHRLGTDMAVRVPDGVSPGDRLAVYARGYLSRLLACLRADFPALRALLGDEIFDGFAIAYLRAHPPRHYSLFELGAGFADHLEATCPPMDVVPPAQRSWLRLPIDLARIERTRLEVTRAHGTEEEVTRATDPTRHSLLEAEGSPYGCDATWMVSEQILVSTPSCLRIVRLDHDVRAFLRAVDHGVDPVRPEPERTVLGVSRVDYRIVLTDLLGWQAQALEQCRTPRSLFELAQNLAERAGETCGAMLAELMVWLPSATASGLLSTTSSAQPEAQG
ncbi:MAG TPA: DNA-binding domain-containing protein [Polyangiales bacterium]